MPRKYTRKTEDSPTDPNKVLVALKAVQIEKCSVKSVARDHNIPRSSLSRYLTKINQEFSDISTISDQQLLDCIKSFTSRGNKTVFSPSEEEALLKYLLDGNQFGLELKRNEVCRKTLEFAKKIAVTYPESWNVNEMASRDWYEAFMRRRINLIGQPSEQMNETIEMDMKNDVCLACLGHSDSEMTSLLNHIIEISDLPQNCSEQLSMAEMYKQCIGIEVDSPQHMLCVDCAQKLTEFHKFRRICQKSYDSLCQMHEKCVPIKMEINDNKETISDDIFLQENQTKDDTNSIEGVLIIESEDEMSEQSDIAEREEFKSSEELQIQQKTMVESFDDSETQITCDMCSKKFFKKHRYEAHFRTHAGQKPYQCVHCEKGFIKYYSLKEHLTTKHCPVPKEKSTFVCDVNECRKTYSHKDSLRMHILKVHSEMKTEPMETKKVICETCGKGFQSNCALIRHNYSHTKTSSHKCKFFNCGKMFPTSFKLKEHTMRHEGIKNFSCFICGLRKTTNHELRVHMKNHNKEVTYPCPMCSVVFTQSMNMKRHMKVVHCGIKNFKCDHCNRTFAKLETLRNHIMTHTGEKPFGCSLCDRRFIQQVALKTHLKTHQKKNR